MFGDASEVGVDIGVGAEFAGGAEEIRDAPGVEGLLVVEAALAVGVEDAEVFVVAGARHAAGAAVGERELAEIGENDFFGFHGISFERFFKNEFPIDWRRQDPGFPQVRSGRLTRA